MSTTTPTNNPIPSESPRDFRFNIGNFDRVMNSDDEAYQDRFGKARLTMAGFEAEANRLFQTIGWVELGDWAVGLTVTTRNQIVYYNGSWYRYMGTQLPYTITASSPDSNWVNIGDASLRQELHAPSGASLISYKHDAAGSVSRTVQSKLEDFVFIEDFGGGVDVTDNTSALTSAFAASNCVRLRDEGEYRIVTGGIELPEDFILIGAGQRTQIKYFGTTPLTPVFYQEGSADDVKRAGIISNLTFSADVTKENFIKITESERLYFVNVFFYNAGQVFTHVPYANYQYCELWASRIYSVSRDSDEVFTGSMKMSYCFLSNSPLYIYDMADLSVSYCHFFAGPVGIQFRITRTSPSPDDLHIGVPVFVSNNVFDAIEGKALDLEGIAYGTIANNFISANRISSGDGATITGVWSSNVVGNTFTYCGRYGLLLERGVDVTVTANSFNGNKLAGLAIVNSERLTVSGCTFGTTKVSGGWYVQPGGLTDPGSNCHNVTVAGCTFDDQHTNKIFLDFAVGSTNKVAACSGVRDSVSSGGATGSRPTAPFNGEQYYDVTLGIPVYYNATSGTWKNAMGADV